MVRGHDHMARAWLRVGEWWRCGVWGAAVSLEQRVQTALAAHQEDKKLRLLASGYRDAWNACSAERTSANLKGLETWESKLSTYLDDLPDAPGQEAKALPDPLMKPYHVWLYLRELGYSVSKEQPKRDINAKKLVPQKSGGFSKASVRRYALTCKLKRLDGSAEAAEPPAPPMDEIGAGAEKAQQQARLARLQADKIELALERERGNLVPAADLAITLASFGAVVEHELKSQMRSKSAKLLALVQGDATRKAAFVREMTDLVDAALRHAAEIEEYRVQFEGLGGGQ